MPSRVLLVEDVDELRATMRQAFRLHGGFEVVDDVADGASAIAAARAHSPDVVVLDLGLPDLAGAELVTRVRAAAPMARIVVYTGNVTPEASGISQAVDAVVQKDRSVRYLVGLLANLGSETPYTAQIQLGPSMADVRVARRFLEENCVKWGCAKALADVRLVLSELVTNALVHGGSRCELRARFTNGLLRIEVRDRGSGTPDLRAPAPESEGGRGLMIVSSMSQSWGVDADEGGGKVVWAEIVVGPSADGSPGG
jgi:CheY-like chemotaxis protein